MAACLLCEMRAVVKLSVRLMQSICASNTASSLEGTHVGGPAAVLMCFTDVAIICRIFIEPCWQICGNSWNASSVL